MLGKHFYNESIRKTIVGFGTLFNNIELRRKNKENQLVQTIKVPLAYGPREKFLARIEAEPNLDKRKSTQIQLPRISFEVKNISYDAARKLGPVQVCRSPKAGDTENTISHYMPVPYNLDFELNIISKNNDDAVQILEQILPYFQPFFSITIKMLEDTNEYKDVPILMTNVSIQDDYEGNFVQRRSIIYTLTFTAKTFIYGPVTTSDVIKKVNVDIGAAIQANRYVRYSVTPKALEDLNDDGVVNAQDDLLVESDDDFGFNEMWTYSE
jgi:hypothetical protein